MRWTTGLLLGALLAAPSVARAQEAPGAAEQAQLPYERGLILYDQDRYEAAIEQFRASLAVFSSPNPRLYIARCLRELGRITEAAREYELVAGRAAELSSRDPRYALTRDAARNELFALRARIGLVTLEIAPEPELYRVTVGGTEITPRLLHAPLAVSPGDTEIVVDADGFLLETRQVHVDGGGETRLAITLRRGNRRMGPPPDPGSGMRTAAWVSFGVGAVGIVGWGAFSLLADGQYQNLTRMCGSEACPTSLRGAINTGRTYDLVGNVALGVGIAGLVAGGIFFAVSTTQRPPPVVVGFDGSRLTVGGMF